jgi:hypothetical protein
MFTGPIQTLPDVIAFFHHLVAVDRISFHPDQHFAEYVSVENGSPSFTPEQAAHYDALMDRAFAVCRREGADIYEIGIQHLEGISDG